MIRVPRSKLNRLLSVVLLLGISLTAAGIALAVQPNPGHDISALGGVVQGDILYGSATDVVSKLVKDANATRYLSNTGASNNPAWAQINLANGVTGTIGTANLGSGTANSTSFLRGDSTWVVPATGAPSTATYITQTTDAGLSGEQALSALGTGYMKVTTGTGVVTSQAAPIPVTDGGAGAAPGATDQVLVSDSTSAATWRTINDCTGNGKALQFAAATNLWGCNTLQFYNQSVTTVSAAFAADTYLVGSSVAIPSVGLQAGTRYHMIFQASKTGAGVATPILTVRYGTLGTTGDSAKCVLTFAAQTAVADTGTFDVWVTFRTVGSGTTAVLQCVSQLLHAGTAGSATAVGFGGTFIQTVAATSAGFDSTVANSIIGTSVNGGASAAWTITLVQAELTNLQ